MFNSAAMGVATFVTVWVHRFALGPIRDTSPGFTVNFISSVCLLAIVQYVMNSGLIAIAEATKRVRASLPSRV